MITVEVDENFIIRNISSATRILILLIDTNVGLVQFIDIVVNYNVNLALVFEIKKRRNFIRHIFRCFNDIFANVLSALVVIGGKIITVVILESKVFVLHSVLTKSLCIALCERSKTKA